MPEEINQDKSQRERKRERERERVEGFQDIAVYQVQG
jgi:hypothetical protein